MFSRFSGEQGKREVSEELPTGAKGDQEQKTVNKCGYILSGLIPRQLVGTAIKHTCFCANSLVLYKLSSRSKNVH